MKSRISDPPPNMLATILAATRRAVRQRERGRPRADIERAAEARTPRGAAFREALAAPAEGRVIAECKHRSPSRGVLRPRYAPGTIARSYEAVGAAAVSVLTDPAFFGGQPDHLDLVRNAVAVPVLRKDFVVTEYQVVETRALGADAVLLIVAALDRPELEALLALARAQGLAALVEVHSEAELAVALESGAEIVGVNNRDLRTLAVGREMSFALIAQIPDTVVAVAESGLRTSRDLIALRQAGYDAFLIGETLLTREDPGQALHTLLSGMGKRQRPRRPAAA